MEQPIEHWSNDELLERIYSDVREARFLMVNTIAVLMEIDRRGLHLQMAFSTLYDFCHHQLRMSEDQAYRYSNAAKLAARFGDSLLDDLESGAHTLAGLALLKKHLASDDNAWLLDEARGQSKRAIERLLAKHFPKHTRARDRVVHLSETQVQVTLTMSVEALEQLRYAAQMMSHSNPGHELGPVIERAAPLLVTQLERSRQAKPARAGSPKRVEPVEVEVLAEVEVEVVAEAVPEVARVEQPAANSSAVARPTKREVFARDGWQCSFVSKTGDRCTAKSFLELDHEKPRAWNGTNDAANLRVLCRFHNAHAARMLMGHETIDEAIAKAKATKPSPPGQEPPDVANDS